MPGDDNVPLGAVMVDLHTVRTRDGKKSFDNALQIVENERGERTGHEKAGHKSDSKYRDLRLNQIHTIHQPDGTIKEVAEYVPE